MATVDRILAAATQVLVERGLQGFNTNVVAESAGVNVGTLYHYFGDKNAILFELYQRDQEVRTTAFGELVQGLGVTDDLPGHVHRIIDSAAQNRASSPAAVVLRRACRAVPEMGSYDREVTEAFTSMLSAELAIRAPGLGTERLRAAAMTMVELSRSVLDLIGEVGEPAPRLQRELELVLVSYLRELDRAASEG